MRLALYLHFPLIARKREDDGKMNKENILFTSEGVNCVAHLYWPDTFSTEEKFPVIVMAHGFSLVKEAYLPKYAEVFTKAGLAVFVFDYRFFGESEGTPRQHLIPAEQIKDYRNAITFVSQHPRIDAARIGIWGTSYSGGHVLHTAAVDRRVKAVVAQVPTINGWRGASRKMGPEKMAAFLSLLEEYRTARYHGAELRYINVVSDKGELAAQPSAESFNWFTAMSAIAPTWENRITLESMESYLEYNPAGLIDIISPTPLLIIAAEGDAVTPADLARDAFDNKAREPKQWLQVPGGHFDVYDGPSFEQASQAAAQWFTKHLQATLGQTIH
jgi:uncharacterized protein